MELAKIAILAGFSVAAMLFLIPIVAILTYHRRKLEEIRMKRQVSIAEETRAAIEAVRKEVAALRDTTTEYDVSFDTALHRLESRTGNLERRMAQVEQGDEVTRLGVGQESYRAVQ